MASRPEYHRLSKKLEEIKRRYENNSISQVEYKERRKEILEDYSSLNDDEPLLLEGVYACVYA